MRPIRAIFTIKGRARRRDYGTFFLVTALVYLAAGIPDFIRLGSHFLGDGSLEGRLGISQISAAMSREVFVALIVTGALMAIALYVAWIAMCVRRLHDMNLAGGFVILCVVISLFPGLGYLLASLVLGLWPGAKGPNGYGPDPRRPLAIADVFGPGSS